MKTPEYIEARTRRQQALVPSLGLGFLKMDIPKAARESITALFVRSLATAGPEQPIEYLLTTAHPAMPTLLAEDRAFNLALLETLRPLHEQWAGRPLVSAVAYGIRIYLRGSSLHNHVDTLDTHVIASTLCVDHELAAPWPLYIEDGDGQAHEVSLEPGQMVLYEGARLKHGRAYPLDGEFYAGLFLHYTPVGWKASLPAGWCEAMDATGTGAAPR